MRRHPALVLPIEKYSAFVRSIKSGDRAKRSGFAASGRPQKKEQLPGADGQSQVVDCPGLAEDFGDRLKFYANRHVSAVDLNAVFSNCTLLDRAREKQRRIGYTIRSV